MRSLLSLTISPGAPTYLVSPVDFAQNPLGLFLTLARYKIKDTYATPQMLDHAINMLPAKGFNLAEVKNMMISFDCRPRPEICKYFLSLASSTVKILVLIIFLFSQNSPKG